jgi:dipeptidase E
MKLLLCSEGFHTPNTVEELVKLCGKPKEQISFAIINEAYAAEEGDKRWVLHNLNCVAENYSGEIDIVNLLALPIDEVEARINSKDVIFVVGGHTDYLMSVYKKTGFAELLPKLLETKVYVGSSAGSIVMGRRLDPEAFNFMYDKEKNYGIEKYMELVNFTIMPHLDSPERVDRKEKLIAAAKMHSGKIYGLNDDAAVVVDGGKVYTIGSAPLEF